ncbi:MAG: acyl-CoA dehydrogenase family protein [Acidimicrobiales bacterium]
MIEGDDRELLERSLRHAVDGATGPALDLALDALGWPDALEVDPHTAVSLLFELQGSANRASSALDRVVAAVVAPASDAAGVVLPTFGSPAPPARLLDDGRLTIEGLATAALPDRDTVVVVARRDEGEDVVVTVAVDDLEIRRIAGVDPDLGLVAVTGTLTPADAPRRPARPWPDAVARAQLAIGHELVGAARTMVALARQHALDRVQFGQPIARFQAIRHRLADTLVAIEVADAALDAGWLEGTPTAAAMAKALAGDGARTAARHCQQVLAGIGFTTEHDLHRWIRRVLVLDELFGAARTLTRALGEDLLATRQLPPLPPL